MRTQKPARGMAAVICGDTLAGAAAAQEALLQKAAALMRAAPRRPPKRLRPRRQRRRLRRLPSPVPSSQDRHGCSVVRRGAVAAPRTDAARIGGRECRRWTAAGSARANAQDQGVKHGAESKEAEQLVDQEPHDRHDIEHQRNRAADGTATAGCPADPSLRPEMRPPSHASMTALPNSDMQNNAPTTNGTAAMPITVTHSKISSTGVRRMPNSAANAVCPG